jgi:hypothetical protein
MTTAVSGAMPHGHGQGKTGSALQGGIPMQINRPMAIAMMLSAAVSSPAAAQRGVMGMGASGTMGMPHDSAAAAQMSVIRELMLRHELIKRSVTNLDNGVRTVTESDDARLSGLIRKHTIEMTARVAAGDDPTLPMESTALRTIFRNRDRIRTRVDTSAAGIVVEQTSDDSLTVAALQQHAAEVSALAREGMAAMRDAMMRRRTGPPPVVVPPRPRRP